QHFGRPAVLGASDGGDHVDDSLRIIDHVRPLWHVHNRPVMFLRSSLEGNHAGSDWRHRLPSMLKKIGLGIGGVDLKDAGINPGIAKLHGWFLSRSCCIMACTNVTEKMLALGIVTRTELVACIAG